MKVAQQQLSLDERIGARVRVAIRDTSKWSSGYGDVLQGLTGVVERFSPVSFNGDPSPGPAHLIAFDAPPRDPSPMAPKGRRVSAFWLATVDLEFLSCSRAEREAAEHKCPGCGEGLLPDDQACGRAYCEVTK